MRRLGSLLVVGAVGVVSACGGDSAPAVSTQGDASNGAKDGGGGTSADGGTFPTTDASLMSGAAVQVSVVKLGCDGDCAQVEAVAFGGFPPYSFKWEDGSTDSKRTICDATARYEVTVTDTGIDQTEFMQPATTDTSAPTSDVITCGSEPGNPSCDEPVAGLPAELTPPLTGEPGFFADGAELPAGRYRVEYVDGCLRFDPSIYFWTVNGFLTFQWYVIQDSTANQLSVAPGVSSLIGYPGFPDCVAANQGVPPFDFDFTGGKLGIFTNDFKPDDNLAGDGGRSPKWRLSQVCN